MFPQKAGRRLQTVAFVVIVGLVASACSSGAVDIVSEAADDVDLTGLAFVDSSLGSTLAVSVSPNDAGLQWIDIVLDEDDRVRSVASQFEDGRLVVDFDDDAFVLSAPYSDVTISGEFDRNQVVVVADGETTTESVDLPESSPEPEDALLHPVDYEIQTLGFGAVLAEDELVNSNEYMVDRPTHITADVAVDVTTEVDGAPIDPIAEATGFGLSIENCSSTSVSEADRVVSCSPSGVDQVEVSVSMALPPAEDLREEVLGVFASRERCEAWSELNGRVGLGWTVVGALAPVAGKFDPRMGASVAVTATVMGLVHSRSGSVPCGTITVADELIGDYRDDNADFTIDLEVSAVAREYDFSTESLAVQPFSQGRPAGALTLVGTRLEQSSDEQLEWTAEIEWTSDSIVQAGPATITITREPGTDDFNLVAVASTLGEHSFVVEGQIDPVECTSVQTDTLEATGTFSDDGGRLLFDGTGTSEFDYSDCPGEGPDPHTADWTDYPVEITDSGLTGSYSYGTFTISGTPPTPTTD